MLPPPAPISDTSMTGSFSACPLPLVSWLLRLMPDPTSYSEVLATAPFSTIDALAVVPPISRVMIFGYPPSAADVAAPMTPAAGPDSTMLAGFFKMASVPMTPPLDCMIRKDAPTPTAFNFSRSELM